MKPIFKNVRNEKLTTGASVALLLVMVARLFGLKTEELAGIPISTIAEAAVEIVSAIVLLFARDPKRNNTGETPQNNK